jgi:hypothetical protein
MVAQNFDETYYQNDFKLEHTIIENILYFYNVKKQEYSINSIIELFGKSFLIKNNTHSIRGYNKADILEYKIIEVNDGKYFIKTANTKILVGYDSYIRIKQHCDKINGIDLEEREKFVLDIENKVNKYLEEDDLALMINDYIDSFPSYYFLHSMFIIRVETLMVSTLNKYSDVFLLSDKTMREQNQREKYVLDKRNVVRLYYENKLKVLFKNVQKRYNLSDDVSVYVTYLLLHRLVMKKFALEWEREYGEYFKNILEMNLDAALDTYFSLNLTDYNKYDIYGKFIYYLMDNGRFKNNNNNYLLCYNELMTPYILREKLRDKRNIK